MPKNENIELLPGLNHNKSVACKEYDKRGGVNVLVVAKDGSGDFSRISDALRTLEEQDPTEREHTIYIKKGIYEERVEVKIPFVTMIGEDWQGTIITGCMYAYMPREDIGKLGTFRSYTMFVDTHDFTAVNLTIQNTAGTGPGIGQAVALYADGDRLIFEHCRLLGNTDTLFTGPLPPFELKKHGFVGPKQFAERINGRQLYRDCYIEGDVDFIFGSATAYFEGCTIFSKNRHLPINGYVTAASTAEGQEYGYVFDRCSFLSDCPGATVYLGRPWRNYAKTIILNSYLGSHIRREGWHNWDKKEAEETIDYGEYHNFGEGAVPEQRPRWSHQLTENEAAKYQKQMVLAGSDHWQG